MTRRILIVLIIVVGLGGVFVAGVATFAGADDHATFTQSGPIRQLEVEVESGRVQIVAQQANEARVERTRRYVRGKPHAEETFVDGVLRLQADCPSFVVVGCKVDYRVAVPAATAVRVRTRSGSVSVTEIAGMIDVETKAGGVRLDRTRGPVKASTSAGNLDGTDLVAPFVDATTGAGHIRLSLSEPSPRLTLRTDAGGVDVALPPAQGGYRVTTDTHAGKAEVTVAQDPSSARAVEATTGAGNIRVHPR